MPLSLIIEKVPFLKRVTAENITAAAVGTSTIVAISAHQAHTKDTKLGRSTKILSKLTLKEITPMEYVDLSVQNGVLLRNIEKNLKGRKLMREDQCLSEVPIEGTGVFGLKKKREIKMVPDRKQSPLEPGGRKLVTPPNESLPPIASVSQNYFKGSRHANSEACEPEQELAACEPKEELSHGALLPGTVIYTQRPDGPVVEFTIALMGVSFLYVVIWPLLTGAQHHVLNLLGQNKKPIYDERPVSTLEILEKFNTKRITLKQAETLLKKYGSMSQLDISLLLEEDKTSS